MNVYKILTGAEWDALQSAGETAGAPIDIADGFVHFSTAAQVRETAAKHFAGQAGLWLLRFRTHKMAGSMVWETSRGGALFPHLYGPLRLAEVEDVWPLPLSDGVHRFPEALE